MPTSDPARAQHPSWPFASIVIGYLDAPPADDALALAVDLAAPATGSPIRFIVAGVVWASLFELEHAITGPPLVLNSDRERLGEALRQASAHLARHEPSRPGGDEAPAVPRWSVETRIVASSSVARGLHDVAEDEQADLLVVGSSHRGPVGQTLIGRVSERLLHGAPCALAVAPRGYATTAPRALRAIGVAFDGSPDSWRALRAGSALARAAGATLRIVMAVEPPTTDPGRWVPLTASEPAVTLDREQLLQRQQEHARQSLDAAAQQVGADLEVEPLLEHGEPARVLSEASSDASLLVVGSRGYGAARRTLLGSVTSDLLRCARCPVLVIPRGEERRRSQWAPAPSPD